MRARAHDERHAPGAAHPDTRSAGLCGNCSWGFVCVATSQSPPFHPAALTLLNHLDMPRVSLERLVDRAGLRPDGWGRRQLVDAIVDLAVVLGRGAVCAGLTRRVPQGVVPGGPLIRLAAVGVVSLVGAGLWHLGTAATKDTRTAARRPARDGRGAASRVGPRHGPRQGRARVIHARRARGPAGGARSNRSPPQGASRRS
jgi:hypothetical protein